MGAADDGRIQRGRDAAAEASDGEEEENAAMSTDEKPVTILVAEDNDVNQLVVEQILETTGHSFLIVPNGREAVDAHARLQPKVILMDVSMPVMNGLEATKAIREAEEGSGRRTPIIGLTAHALKGDREMCMDAGMDDYMSKPISPDKLTDKITEWLGHSGDGDTTAQAAAS
jgi:CheY-like chemotaxis protein